jgi:hypothetical protein
MDRDRSAARRRKEDVSATPPPSVSTRSTRAGRIGRALLALAGILPCLLAAPAALAAETVVTALFGTARAGDDDVAIGDQLSGDDSGQLEVVTSLRSGCALLHGETLLVEMGPSTKLKIRDAAGSSGPVVEILDGSARITTRLDASDAATEIRTPSAIVLPRSSTLHLEVNGDSGTTFVSSLDNRAFVHSSDDRYKRTVFLNSSQWVSVPKGEPPGGIEKLDDRAAESLEGADTLRLYRGTALAQNMHRESEVLLADIVLADVPEGELESLAVPLPTPRAFAFESEVIDRRLVCDPTTCGLFSVPEFDPGPSDPPGCIGIPGEQCQH